MFADDCIVYTIGNDYESMYRKLQFDLDSFIEWCSLNGLKINAGKTKAMISTTSTRLKNLRNVPSFKILGKDVQFVKQYNYLGLMLDNEMTLVPLLKNIKKRVNNKIFMLRKLRKYLTKEAAIFVYKQTILPILDYAVFFY